MNRRKKGIAPLLRLVVSPSAPSSDPGSYSGIFPEKTPGLRASLDKHQDYALDERRDYALRLTMTGGRG